jgi:hypothetical protein
MNERDTEPSGFQSWGVFQVSVDEARSVRVDGDLLNLETNVRVMLRLAHRNRMALRAALNLSEDEWPDPPHMPAYLAFAHNAGLWGSGEGGSPVGAVHSVLKNGMDWDAFEKRNTALRIVTSRYGRDCLGLH